MQVWYWGASDHMWKHIAANALTVIIVLLVGAAVTIGWAQKTYRAEGPLETAVCVKVPPGGSFRAVSQDLADRGAISNDMLFRVGSDYSGRSNLLKAGSYLVEPGASMEEIAQLITTAGRSTCGSVVNLRIGIARTEVDLREMNVASGRLESVASFVPGEDAVPSEYEEALAEGDLTYRVILAEGVTSWQVVDGLNRAPFLTGDAGPVPDEGLLAPRDYEIRAGASRADLIARMRSEQERVLAAAWADRSEGLPLETPEEALILASIIEKETAVAEERRTIAQVFVNRLQQGIRLQTDPTVIYGITQGQGILGRGLRRSELDRRTPWNTYQIDGLPPTPIANPGEASIRAALNPDGSDFIFFVADGTGGHAFASTLTEHNRNVQKWRAIEAERSEN